LFCFCLFVLFVFCLLFVCLFVCLLVASLLARFGKVGGVLVTNSVLTDIVSMNCFRYEMEHATGFGLDGKLLLRANFGGWQVKHFQR
jgi:hypothetical protein